MRMQITIDIHEEEVPKLMYTLSCVSLWRSISKHVWTDFSNISSFWPTLVLYGQFIEKWPGYLQMSSDSGAATVQC